MESLLVVKGSNGEESNQPVVLETPKKEQSLAYLKELLKNGLGQYNELSYGANAWIGAAIANIENA